MPQTSPDHREHRRYSLTATVIFSWETPAGAVGSGEGTTRDISAKSVFIVTSCLLPVESQVRMEVVLPPLRSNRRGPQLSAKGRVVRTENQGFAAVGDMGFRIEFVETQGGNGVKERKNDSSPFDAHMRVSMLN
jgi:hypothetical protein